MEKTSRARSSELRRPHRARVGISSVEVVVATLIIAAALVPIYGIFVRSRTTITRSRIAYLALQAAREELEEIRQIPFGSLAGHEWEPVSGHVFRRTIPVRPPTSGTSPVAATDLIYPDEYTRIQTRVAIDDVTAPEGQKVRYKRAILEVRYQERGAGTERQAASTGRYVTLVASHNLER